MRWVVASTVLLCAFAAFVGLRYGYAVVTTSETDVINAYAKRYLATRAENGEKGGLSECAAYPGEARGIWIVVSCGPQPYDPARHYEYYVNRVGGLEYQGGPASWGSQRAKSVGPKI